MERSEERERDKREREREREREKRERDLQNMSLLIPYFIPKMLFEYLLNRTKDRH